MKTDDAAKGEMRLAGRCGIYCGACTILRAGDDGGRLLAEVSEQLGVPEDEVRCQGCQGPQILKWRNCQSCQLVACQDSRGFVTCAHCREYEDGSCSKLQRLTGVCQRRGEDNLEGLARFRKGEMRVWLLEQERKWRCAACERDIAWYEDDCHHCGVRLR